MSLFPRIAFAPVRVGPNRRGAELAPILSLLDDSLEEVQKASRQTLSHFKPAFDVKETQEGYTLEGELPGVEQKDINIEFTDEYTLTVKGRVERHSESGHRPQGAIEGEKKEKKPLKPTVEDEEPANNNESKEVSQSTLSSEPAKTEEPAQPQDHYWISERSVGEFSRTFTFPARVNQDAVKASLKNGVLTIHVPKAPAPQTRRIAVE
jgi:HSP20 family molecular chaperone IbpA